MNKDNVMYGFLSGLKDLEFSNDYTNKISDLIDIIENKLGSIRSNEIVLSRIFDLLTSMEVEKEGYIKFIVKSINFTSEATVDIANYITNKMLEASYKQKMLLINELFSEIYKIYIENTEENTELTTILKDLMKNVDFFKNIVSVKSEANTSVLNTFMIMSQYLEIMNDMIDMASNNMGQYVDDIQKLIESYKSQKKTFGSDGLSA
jgi:hypothetical protein